MLDDHVALLIELAGLAAIVALSPFSVLPAVALILHSDRPRAVGFAFAIAWLTGTAMIALGFAQFPKSVHVLDEPIPPWAAWLLALAGLLTLIGGVVHWRRRPPEQPNAVRWTDRISQLTPIGAVIAGLALSLVNPKVVLACAAAGYALGVSELSELDTYMSIAFFGSDCRLQRIGTNSGAFRLGTPDRQAARRVSELDRKAASGTCECCVGAGQCDAALLRHWCPMKQLPDSPHRTWIRGRQDAFTAQTSGPAGEAASSFRSCSHTVQNS